MDSNENDIDIDSGADDAIEVDNYLDESIQDADLE